MQEPNRELREDRIPESKQIKKEQEKQKNLLLLAIAGIVLALAAGLALLLSDSRGNGTSETKVDPYSSFYDYLNGVQTQEDSAPSGMAPSVSANTSVPASVVPNTAPAVSASPSVSASQQTDEPQPTLPETLPQPNGTMVVSNDPQNSFIRQIAEAYHIPAARLTAFYATPNTGQNYVLEWNGETAADGTLLRSADTLRRCFLIDENGNLDSVAATDPDERENMSRVENTFAMQTLIKGVILPKVLEQIES